MVYKTVCNPRSCSNPPANNSGGVGENHCTCIRARKHQAPLAGRAGMCVRPCRPEEGCTNDWNSIHFMGRPLVVRLFGTFGLPKSLSTRAQECTGHTYLRYLALPLITPSRRRRQWERVTTKRCSFLRGNYHGPVGLNSASNRLQLWAFFWLGSFVVGGGDGG